MNLSELQSNLQSLGYGSDIEAQQTDAINDAYREICSSDRWPFLEKQNNALTMTPGVNVVDTTVISDLVEFDAVRVVLPADPGQFTNTENVEPQVMRDLETRDQSLGIPRQWSIIAEKLHFYPFPDQAYVVHIDYIYQPPDLVDGSDVPVIPATFHDVLKWGAASLIAFRQRDVYSGQLANTQFDKRYKKMQDAYKLRQRQTSSRVRKSGFCRPSYWPYASGGFGS